MSVIILSGGVEYHNGHCDYYPDHIHRRGLMKLKWLGHSNFLITSDSSVRIITDPFDESVGYPMPKEAADIVTVSHEHHDHNYTKGASGNFTLIRQPGTFTEKGIRIIGIPTSHDDKGGRQRGKNIIFNIGVDGLNVCHCGDLGHILTAQQASEIGHVDVLLVPVGGYYTIDHDQAAQVVRQLKPTVIVPMHYKTEACDYPIKDAAPFVQVMGGAKTVQGTEIELNKDNLKDYAGVVLLQYL
jgi:L-ascorbate metabolism protein UlaG (beta-lactamase superfamily)